VTRSSVREYAAVQRLRYEQATTRAEKHRLLDEVVAVTGIHRNAAIRMLRRVPRRRATPEPGGRPRQYGPEVAAAATGLWEAVGRIGALKASSSAPSAPSTSPPVQRDGMGIQRDLDLDRTAGHGSLDQRDGDRNGPLTIPLAGIHVSFRLSSLVPIHRSGRSR
jgi:hypothetical protein